ncbi:MAG: isochorismate synthase [Fermentimonas sp.]|nr:isochorismate synthase [Fermentimonas sp.]MDD4010294.1 isochorismate synthase [Fermentimonas sp.]MDD4695954.1 isochorismate synthase [Fermentimonas sp.]
MTLKNSSHKLDLLIENDACFAIYRLPNETSPKFVMQNTGEPKQIFDIEELDANNGFVVAPYRINEETPVLVIRPDCDDLKNIVIPNKQNSTKGDDKVMLNNIDRNEYNRLFEQFYNTLNDGTLKKLVLSRSKSITRNKDFSPGKSFYRAMEKYKNSYVFLFHTPKSGTWLGSTPEILLSGKGNTWHTVALAGTQYHKKEKISWDDKNLREQHLVTSYLLNQLSSFNISPEINGPYTTKAANLAHLKTDLDFTLPEAANLGKLLKSLHPTPAVSGLPKEEAFRFIELNEGYDRRYYTGFVGMLDKSSDTNIYVNLRCMKIGKSLLTLFAGSGLVTSSNSKDEWKETEQKLKTMASIC